MPIFEFKCGNCGKVFEILFKSRDESPATECPHCKSGKTEKILSVFGSRVEKSSVPAAAPCSGCSNEFT